MQQLFRTLLVPILVGCLVLVMTPIMASGRVPNALRPTGALAQEGSKFLYMPLVHKGPPPIQAPVQKWKDAGCYTSWCETGWYASPAIADLDGDSSPEVIAASYSIFILDGATGALEMQIDPDGGREWPGVVVADIDNDSDLEIVSAHGGGYVHAFDHLGNPLWSQQPTPGNELRSLAASDLDANGDLEIIIASTRPDDQWFVYEHNGNLRSGDWPQHGPDSDGNGYTAGAFNENVAVGDLDGDGRGEIVGPNDTHYLAAFHDDGTQIQANSIYGANKPWSRVGVHVDHSVDLRGWAYCGTEHRPNFAHSPPIVVDVNGDGDQEAVVVGNVYNCGTSPYSSLYEMPYILNGDRSRWADDGFDWTAIPVPDGSAGPLSENYNVIESSHPNPVAADLDGDGNLEIIYPSYDGRVHAYWLDKTQHHQWPFEVHQPGEGVIRFAADPVVADLNADGFAELIFASWVQKGTYQTGKLHIVDWKGRPIHEINLPAAYGGSDWNGSLAAPALGDIDGDPDLELVLNLAHSGFVAYDLPGTEDAVIYWSTGRGSNLREGHP
ncbi:MAG: VCBS repeat-containing protein [Anaerolineales bacterium]|nr:VCBS repeat-containing protein [Anaerolineales bacterium]